jgi:NAD-dependent dihydropyrimidine dehydrogenase PreA subunit/flavodoxin
MATIFIHYFTGTGNTAHSVKLISEKLREKGNEVNIIQVRKGIKPPVEVPDFHIIAFPVLSWAAPVLMKKYVSEMPFSGKAKTAILAVNGAIIYNGKLVKGYTGQALEQLEHTLRKKKYDLFLSGNASFPDNWTQFTNPCKPEDIKAIFPIGESEVQAFVEKFLAGTKELYRCGFWNIVWSNIVANLFGYVGRRALGKFYIADEHCTNCGICEKSCPVDAIKKGKEKPWWGTTCEDCNRCINICPEKAIQVSLPLFIIQMILNIGLTVWAIVIILKYIPQVILMDKIFLIPVEIALIFLVTIFLLWVTVVPFDAFFRFLMKVPSIRKFFCASYTASFRRYVAPGFKPLSKI